MAKASRLESLPNEVLLEILTFLEPKHIAALQPLSKRLLQVCRDNVFWRLRCHDESSFLENINLRRGLRFPDEPEPDPIVSVTSAVLGGHPVPGTAQWTSLKTAETERIRIAANWDPTFPGEKVSWYDEYIHRNGPIAVNWFEQPQIKDGDMSDSIEVKGLALYNPGRCGDELFAVSPLDDGSICLWDVNGTRQRKGSMLAKSSPGLICLDPPGASSRSRMVNIGITECVSVDSTRHRAYFAVQGHLMEVDLQTLQIIGHQPYEWTITTLSTADPTVPLTVGTFNGIHLYDSREGTRMLQQRSEHIDGFDRFGLQDMSRVLDPSPLPPYAPLAQSGPESILHLECPGTKDLISDDIFVAGRFSNILYYDRRMFPSIKGSIHSGARLSSLTSLPYPFSCLDSDLRRRGELSIEQIERAKNSPGGRTLIACGEYNTKGSLEVYGLSQSSEIGRGNIGMIQNSTMKNRQTASKAKLLSVANHGTRIVFSDGDGFLKWAERDGFTEVRRHRLGHAEKIVQRSLFASMPGSDEIARKILSTKVTNANAGSQANNDDIIFWTGERLGLVSFTSKPGFAADEFEDLTQTPEEVAAEVEEQLYNDRMRQALERQANDVRFVRYLGAGVQSGI
ncbi:F-box domain-containing protein [Xylariales sp. PMI_506]|nr:F-box domain-containing protein [Xylariales sp. PMI_506]